ncbi:MAG: hypothetical protein JXR12_06145 [Neptunomonas phycophila]|uniref:hypothetical protein n=1 Tax=Neptunomonas phycophila TaxID=1572645 RepID=UPI003B8DC2B9
MKLKLIALAATLMASTAANAVNYVKQENLEKHIAVNGIASNVKVGRDVPMPVITWGADMRTELVNTNNKGMSFRLELQDSLVEQMTQYISGYTPYFRGTMSQGAILNYMVRNNPELAPVAIVKLSDSRGGDVLVTKNGINNLKQLCTGNKTIAVNAYGPHLNLLNRALKDGGCSINDVTVKWVPDLTESDDSPLAALYEPDVDAAIVISPDAAIATASANGSGIGDGSDDSVKGARSMFSTRTAGTTTMDMIFVRKDYFDQNRNKIGMFVHEMLIAVESAESLLKTKNSAYNRWLKRSATLLFNDETMDADAGFLYGDAKHSSYVNNVNFFLNPDEPRNFDNLTAEVSEFMVELGLIDKPRPIAWAEWNFDSFKKGIKNTKTDIKTSAVNQAVIAKIIEKKRKAGTLEDSQFIKFPIQFQPNTTEFSPTLYAADFKEFVEKKSVYPGAVMTLEGHCDPLEYQKVMLKNGYAQATYGKSKEKAGPLVRQSCYDTGIQRAMQVRDAIIKYAKDTMNYSMTPDQFQILSHGLEKPISGMCGNIPCKIKSKQAWLENMRVEVGVTVVEAEASDFELL